MNGHIPNVGFVNDKVLRMDLLPRIAFPIKICVHNERFCKMSPVILSHSCFGIGISHNHIFIIIGSFEPIAIEGAN